MNIIKLTKGKYKNYYAKVKNFPIGMLARKDKDLLDIKKMSSSSEINTGSAVEGGCTDRHFAELGGMLDTEVLFKKGEDGQIEKIDSVELKVPVCNIIPLTPQDEISFQKALVFEKEKKDSLIKGKIEQWKKDIERYKGYLKDDSELDKMKLEELKSLMENVENMKIDN